MTALPEWVDKHTDCILECTHGEKYVKALAIAWQALEFTKQFHLNHLKEPERQVFWKAVEAMSRIAALGKE